MRLGIVRIDPQRDPVLRDGAVQVTFGFKCISEVRVCFEEIGLGSAARRYSEIASSKRPAAARPLPRAKCSFAVSSLPAVVSIA
jgi:hypothetical protein